MDGEGSFDPLAAASVDLAAVPTTPHHVSDASHLDPSLDPDAEDSTPTASTQAPSDTLLAAPELSEEQRARLLEALPSHSTPSSSSSTSSEEGSSSSSSAVRTSEGTGIEPMKLEDGRTPMQLRQHLVGEENSFAWGKVEPWQIPENSGKVGCWFGGEGGLAIDERGWLDD